MPRAPHLDPPMIFLNQICQVGKMVLSDHWDYDVVLLKTLRAPAPHPDFVNFIRTIFDKYWQNTKLTPLLEHWRLLLRAIPDLSLMMSFCHCYVVLDQVFWLNWWDSMINFHFNNTSNPLVKYKAYWRSSHRHTFQNQNDRNNCLVSQVLKWSWELCQVEKWSKK